MKKILFNEIRDTKKLTFWASDYKGPQRKLYVKNSVQNRMLNHWKCQSQVLPKMKMINHYEL